MTTAATTSRRSAVAVVVIPVTTDLDDDTPFDSAWKDKIIWTHLIIIMTIIIIFLHFCQFTAKPVFCMQQGSLFTSWKDTYIQDISESLQHRLS